MASITGTSLDDVLATTADADAVSALAGNDIILIGGADAHDPGETLNGGSGFDRIWYISSNAGETLLLSGVSQVEAVLMVNAGGSIAGTTNLSLDASALGTGLLLVGNDGANTITGGKSHDIIDGNGGVDTLLGGTGNDRITVRLDEATLDAADGGAATEGNTMVLAGVAAGTVIVDLAAAAGADQLLSENAVNDAPVQSDFSHLDASDLSGAGVRVTGSALANVIVGSAQDDTFLYSAASHLGAADVLNGGMGNDTLLFTSGTAGETLTLSSRVAGLETIEIADAAGDNSGTTALNVNAGVLKDALEIVGNDGANRLTGGANNDTLIGNGGDDTLVGGAGNDLIVYEAGGDSSALEKVSGGAGADFIVFASTTASDTLILGAGVVGVEKVYVSDVELVRTGTTALDVDASAMAVGIEFLGNDGANVLTGGKGADKFDGGLGSDTIIAGAGADVVSLDAAALDAADAGNAAEGNTLRLSGAAAAQLAINLSTLADQDQMAGDAPVQSDFTHVDASEMTGNGVAVTASSRVNKIFGTAQDDVFVYNRASHAVDDLVAGQDNEEDGGDTVRFASIVSGETLVIGAKFQGIEAVEIADAAGSTAGTLALNVNATGALNELSLTGNDGKNTLTGGAHNDTLNGNAGADKLNGGAGNDVFEVDSLADYVSGDSMNGGAGEDIVLFSSTTDGEILVLRSAITGVEKFEVAEGAADTGLNGDALTYGARYLGNEGDNNIRGSDFADTIDGGLGADIINGGRGADRIILNVDSVGASTINAGALSEGNTLVLKAPEDQGLFYFVELDQADQLGGVATGSGFTNVDASAMTHEDSSVIIFGDDRANRITGTTGSDFFTPGKGKDIVEGGPGEAGDTWFVASQEEYAEDFYSDSGSERNDTVVFTSTKNGDTLFLKNNLIGVDGADLGGTANTNLDARGIDQPTGLGGNSGMNTLWGNRHGQSIFDSGNADKLLGGGGSDDYTILDETGWLFGVPGPDDVIEDTGSDIDDFYFADSASSSVLVVGTNVTGVERFFVTSGALSESGRAIDGLAIVRETESTHNAGLDAHHIKHKIVLGGNDGNNVLIATAFNDTIQGFKGEDTITAGAGTDKVIMEVDDGIVDTIDAGALGENNILFLRGEATGQIEVRLSGLDQVVAIGGANEGLSQTGFLHLDASGLAEFGVAAYGTSAVNRLTGSEKDDILEGGAGKDVVVGGGGNDAIVLRNTTHQVTGEIADGGAGEDDAVWFAWSSGTTTFKLNPTVFLGIEVLMAADDTGATTGTQALTLDASAATIGMKLVGNDGDNRLIGTSKNDVFTGNGGADRLEGGGGTDTYLYESASEGDAQERIIDSGGAGDVLRFTSTTAAEVLVLGANVSGLDLVQLGTKTGDTSGTETIGVDASAVSIRLAMHGNEGANAISGGAGNDTILGNGGNDTIAAGGGADRIEMGIEAATIDAINAGARSEGNALVVTGKAAGTMVWDLSSDADQLVSIDAAANAAAQTGITHLDLAQVEFDDPAEVVGATITGSAEVNRIFGTLLDDTYIVLAQAHFGAGETFAAGAGTDSVIFASTNAGDSLVLTTRVTGIESVVLQGTTSLNVNAAAIRNGLTIDGNSGNNSITGTAFADVITAGAGADTIVAGAGKDKVKTDLSVEDAVHGGALSEQNEWVLEGVAGGGLVFNLAASGDQLLAGSLMQRGFTHLDARAVTGSGIEVIGSSAANRIAGTTLRDVINGGLGADVITMDAAVFDEINAGALTEGNELVLIGAAPAPLVIDLSSAGDQVAGTDTQSGFAHVDASAMTGNAVTVTGSAAANRIAGTALQDTINAGAGADVVTMDVTSSFDIVNAGAGHEGDMLKLVGEATAIITVNLGVAAGADQVTLLGAGAEGVMQSGFQHLDASKLLDFGVDLRGSGANNILIGTAGADVIAGLGGSDTIDLGVDPGTGGPDTLSDQVLYLALGDGVGAAGAAASRDRILHFSTGQDKFRLGGEFNGGEPSLDDITNNDAFAFATDERADFREEDEALLITAARARLTSDGALWGSSFDGVLTAINKVGVTAAAGDDGLIVVQGKTMTGVYYYVEMGSAGVQAKELTLLAVIDTHAAAGDFNFLA